MKVLMLKRGETMQIFETILIFLAVVIASSLVHILLPKIPLAFIQISFYSNYPRYVIVYYTSSRRVPF